MVYSSNEVRILVKSMSVELFTANIAKFLHYFRQEALDLSFCDVNVYDEADTVVKVGNIALLHYHDQ